MSLELLVLIQAQEPPRLSKAVIAGVILVFLVGASLLVYFFRRYKKTEKESQDEWDRPEQSLFGAAEPSADREQRHSVPEAAVATASAEGEQPDSTSEAELTASLAAIAEPQLPVVAESLTQELKSDEAPTVLASAPGAEISQRTTEVLSSDKQEAISIERDAITESTPFEDDVWAGLEKAEQQVPAATQLLGVEQPADASVSNEPAEPAKPASKTELLGAARVDARPPREPFEPPRVTPIVHREPWEPPHIEPIMPRVQPPVAQSTPTETRTQILASPPALGEQRSAPYVEAIADAEASPGKIETRAPARTAASSLAATRVHAGSVLGLSAERSRAPLVLGVPVRPRDEIGIGALSNYGKDLDGGGGHGGSIALASVILLLGGGIATYLFVPSVNSRVNAAVARARGIDPNPPQPVEQPKARVFPARNEANKNMVKARGAVDNISEETLNNLSVEVSLERGNGVPPKLQTYAVNPAQLAPKQRGIFQFEYDGNRATGFSGYRIVRLLSGEGEIKFTTPRPNG